MKEAVILAANKARKPYLFPVLLAGIVFLLQIFLDRMIDVAPAAFAGSWDGILLYIGLFGGAVALIVYLRRRREQAERNPPPGRQ